MKWQAALPFIVLALALGIGPASALAAPLLTPTPTPTPPPFNNPVQSFYVDPNADLPWDPLVLAPQNTPLPSPTLYAATPIHATDYPNQVATATAQVGAITGPINSITTPVAAMVGGMPTPNGNDLDTGLDPLGTGNITFAGFAATIEDQIVPVVSTGKAFIVALYEFGAYSPPVALLVGAEVTGVVIGAFIGLLIFMAKVMIWLVNLILRVLTFLRVIAPI